MADSTDSHHPIDTIHPTLCDDVSMEDICIPRSPLHAVTSPRTTILDLSFGLHDMDKRLDPTFVAISLSAIPTLEIIRFYNVISSSTTNEPCHSKAHLPNLRSLELIENGTGIVALLSQLSIPTNTVLDLEANADTPLTTSVELIATVGHILEGSGGAVTQILQTLSVLTEYGRLIVKGYDYFLGSGDPEAPADLRLSIPAYNWRDRNGLIEGIAYGLPISLVKMVHTDTSLLKTLSDDILCLFFWSLCSLRSFTWTDPNFPVTPDKDDKYQCHWDSGVKVRAGGESKLASFLYFMTKTIEDDVYCHDVARILALCAKSGFGIRFLYLGLRGLEGKCDAARCVW